MKPLQTCLAVLFAILSTNLIAQTTYTAVANDNFEKNTTWSPTGNPGDGDIIIIPVGYTVTVTTNYGPLLGNMSISGILAFNTGSKLSFQASSLINVNSGGSITGGSIGSQIIFPSTTYSGIFAISGPYYYSNTGSGTGVLPILLNSFQCTKNETGIIVNWKAENENTTTNYELQWSNNGIDNWKTINSQKPKNSGTTIEYSFTHNTGITTNNYYRLKTNLFNGTFSFSNIIISAFSEKKLFQAFPTKVSNTITCRLDNNIPSQIRITDITGKLVYSDNNANAAIYSINVSNLQTGAYFISLIQNGQVSTLKFIKE